VRKGGVNCGEQRVKDTIAGAEWPGWPCSDLGEFACTWGPLILVPVGVGSYASMWVEGKASVGVGGVAMNDGEGGA